MLFLLTSFNSKYVAFSEQPRPQAHCDGPEVESKWQLVADGVQRSSAENIRCS